MSRSCWRRFFLIVGFLLSAIAVAITAEATLDLQPKEEVQKRPISDTTMVACSAFMGSPIIPTANIRWLDPSNNTIPKDQGLRKHTEYVQGKLMLLIQATVRADEGIYTCVADVEDRQLSASFELKTFMELAYVDTPELQHPTANISGYIRCSVISEPPAEVDWILNNNKLEFEEGGRCKQKDKGIFCQPILKEDSGNYVCRARVLAIGKMKRQEIRVEVHTPPKIHSLNGTFNAIEDKSVILTCNATGDPLPFYSWEDKNNGNLKGRPGYRVDEEHGTLTIEKVSKEDAGAVRCIANNSAGEDIEQATLTVTVKPNILKLNNVTVASGQKAKLSCQVYAEPNAAVEFVKLTTGEKYTLSEDSDDMQENHVHVSVGPVDNGNIFEKDYTLEFLPVERLDDSLYQCTASNKGGTVSALGHLQVEYAPEFTVMQATQWSWFDNPVNLTCSVDATPSAKITWMFKGKEIDAYQDMIVYESENNSTLYIYPSGNNYFGFYVCKASNKIGDREMNIELKLAQPPGEMNQVNLKPTATTMTFELYGPDSSGTFPITHYAVEYKKSDETEMKRRIWKINTPYVLDKLEPLKTYHFRVSAVSQVGHGPWKDHDLFTMPERAAPVSPPITSLGEEDRAILIPSPNTYELTWDLPADNGETILGFQIIYCEASNATGKFELVSDWIKTDIQHPGPTSHAVHQLKPNTLYKFEIRAQNIIGNSEPSSVYIWTSRDPRSVYFEKTEQTPISLDPSDQPRVTMVGMSFGVIVAIAIIIIVFIMVIIDVTCYFANQCGVTFFVCVHVCKKDVSPNEKVKEAALEEGNGPKSMDSKGAMKGPMDEDDLKNATEETPMIDGKNGRQSEKIPSAYNKNKSENFPVAV